MVSRWESAIALGKTLNDQPHTTEAAADLVDQIRLIREDMGQRALTSNEPTTVVFGTSGWRGKIGEDFTVLNVAKVTRAIIDMMRTDEFLQTNGYKDFSLVQQKGILVFRDNRYMGELFMDVAMKELFAAGIKLFDAGECPTGVGSALVTELGVAGSLNFTPSHNPMDYAGLKFNPADGGPADTILTNLIMKESLKYMNEPFMSAETTYTKTTVHAAEIYIKYLDKQFRSGQGLIDVPSIRQFLLAKKDELYLLIDNMHGASRGFIEAILGATVMAELDQAGSIEFLHTDTDYAFHGVKPEPSEKNQAPLIKKAREKVQTEPKRSALTLVVALDPDADRIRLGTAFSDIDMNKFGAIAYGHLLKLGFHAPVATTLPSSKFALAIAKKAGQSTYEVLVGFKWFRPLTDALVKYEESDGISFRGHTLEKDGIAGFLMALQVMKDQQKDIAAFYAQLQTEVGYYYPEKAGHDVTGISIESWVQLRKDVQADITTTYKIGDVFTIGNTMKTIVSTRTEDGLMMVFDDNSWILVRSSGTEPKFRVYFEITSDKPLTLDVLAAITAAYKQTGLDILKRSLSKF